MPEITRILVAEDNHFYRRILVSALSEWGYDAIQVPDGQAAWEILQRPDAPQIAILDWVMPGLDGIEVCRRVRGLRKPESTYVIVLTSKEGKENIVEALENGADDYVTKPFDREELRARLNVGLRIVGLQTSRTVVFAFARAVEGKTPYTQGHAKRVTEYAIQMAEHLKVSNREIEILREGGLLHDIGKICVPDSILDKPGMLTPEERAIIQQHPSQGVAMVEPLKSLAGVIPLIRWHHERLDGRGYPDGLTGDQIPDLVRILSVADVYDALSCARPYRDAIPHEVCLEMLWRDVAGGALDEDYVRLFVEIFASPPLIQELTPLPRGAEKIPAAATPQLIPADLADGAQAAGFRQWEIDLRG